MISAAVAAGYGRRADCASVSCRANGVMETEMAEANTAGYLPGDPRYGLQGEALANYYRTKAAQWAIYCWDIGERSDAVLRTAMPGTEGARRALLPEQKAYVKNFGERVIGYGHFL